MSHVHILTLEYPGSEEFPDVRVFTTEAAARAAMHDTAQGLLIQEQAHDEEAFIQELHADAVDVESNDGDRLHCLRVSSAELES